MDSTCWMLVAGAGALMSLVLLRGIAGGAAVVAGVMVDDRRREEERRRADNAAAEEAGKAAAMEPLNLNPDGTIEEPILAMAENG